MGEPTLHLDSAVVGALELALAKVPGRWWELGAENLQVTHEQGADTQGSQCAGGEGSVRRQSGVRSRDAAPSAAGGEQPSSVSQVFMNKENCACVFSVAFSFHLYVCSCVHTCVYIYFLTRIMSSSC